MPQPGDPERFSFLALGDSGDSAGLTTDETPQDAVARFLAEEAAPPVGSGRGEFVLHTGDVVYMTGERRLYDRNFRRPYAPFLTAESTVGSFVFRIPFLPVQRPGSSQDIAFQRAAMPQMDTPPRDVIRAKGVLLNEPALPWFVNEEEIPYAGTIVTRAYQRVRWYDGRTYVWIGRQRRTGRGVGSSNLRFDQIEPTQPASG